MGCCWDSSLDGQMNRSVDDELQADKDRNKIKKLLFLGSGGSGKSTFFKQLRFLHGNGYDAEERRVIKEHISAQIIKQINRCVECIPFHNDRLPADCDPLALSADGKESARFLEGIGQEVLVDEVVAGHIAVLWQEAAIRQIYQNRAIYHIDDSSSYFFDEIDRIGDLETYVPTDLDILNVHHRTTGVIEATFNIKNSRFHIFDLGGQQSGWSLQTETFPICFEAVAAVIFVASLSCYDEVLFEDDSINSMVDSLELFREICNLQWFVTTPIILFLNKRDLFEQKINIIPLSVCFQEYSREPPPSAATHSATERPLLAGDDDDDEEEDDEENVQLLEEQRVEYMKDARDYIKGRFTEYSGNDNNRQIYVHVTCATDRRNVQKLFNDVQQIVVSEGLKRQDLM